MLNKKFTISHIENLNKVIPLINYDLELNGVKIFIDINYIFDYHNSIDIRYNSVVEEEKIKSTLNFYSFIMNDEFCQMFSDISDYIIKEKPWIFSNTFLSEFSESFNNNKKFFILFLASIVIKVFSNPSYYRKSFYELNSTEIINADSWYNSDIILESLYVLINNYIIYNNLKIEITDLDQKNKIKKFKCFAVLFKFINVLVKNKNIKEKIIKISTNKKKFKTIKYWSLSKDLDTSSLISESNFSLTPYQVINHFGILYEKGGHYSKIVVMCRKNWYSGEIFNLSDSNYINKILILKLYIDTNFLRKTISILEERNEIIVKNIADEIKELSIELKSIFNQKIIYDRDKIIIKNKQKEINKLIDILRIKKVIEKNEIKPIYLPVFFDFRGRNYFDDCISPTFSKIMRFAFYYGFYTDEEILSFDDSIIKEFITIHEKTILKVINIYNLKNEKYITNSVFWLLIGIGKHFISKKIKTPLKEFLDKGLYFIQENMNNNKFIDVKIKDYIEIIRYTEILKNLNEKPLKKNIILKDATASVIQNLIKILGAKDQNSVNLANLGDTLNWYDPYTHILEKFKNSFVYKDDKLKYFIRKTIKKTIMINPYSAGLESSWNYFKNDVRKNFEVTNDEIEDLYNIFKNFYNFITDFFEELHFFKNPSKAITNYYLNMAKKENKIILISDDSTTNLIYYEHKIHYIDVLKEDGKRITKKIKKIDYKKIDYKKIQSSIRANIAHWLDAIFLRKLVNKLNHPIFTIHDEFAIDILNVNILIKYANEIANESIKIDLPWNIKNEFKIFSIFILI